MMSRSTGKCHVSELSSPTLDWAWWLILKPLARNQMKCSDLHRKSCFLWNGGCFQLPWNGGGVGIVGSPFWSGAGSARIAYNLSKVGIVSGLQRVMHKPLCDCYSMELIEILYEMGVAQSLNVIPSEMGLHRVVCNPLLKKDSHNLCWKESFLWVACNPPLLKKVGWGFSTTCLWKKVTYATFSEMGIAWDLWTTPFEMVVEWGLCTIPSKMCRKGVSFGNREFEFCWIDQNAVKGCAPIMSVIQFFHLFFIFFQV